MPIYEAGEQDGRLFIAMRYVRGPDLKALLRQMGALEPARALEIARQLAGAWTPRTARAWCTVM